jgi:polyvinyl alcohol dehydrogenase (cytochrome)
MMAQLAPDDVPRLKLKWAFGYPGAVRAFAQPNDRSRSVIRR